MTAFFTLPNGMAKLQRVRERARERGGERERERRRGRQRGRERGRERERKRERRINQLQYHDVFAGHLFKVYIQIGFDNQ